MGKRKSIFFQFQGFIYENILKILNIIYQFQMTNSICQTHGFTFHSTILWYAEEFMVNSGQPSTTVLDNWYNWYELKMAALVTF